MMKAVQSHLGSNWNFGQPLWEKTAAEHCGALGAAEEFSAFLIKVDSMSLSALNQNQTTCLTAER